MQLLILALLVITGAYATVAVLYYLGLGLSYFVTKEHHPPLGLPQTRFAVLIPARDEEQVLALALDSWARVAYPEPLHTVYVIADNCTDGTADVARSRGVRCLERHEPEAPGKGQALAWALTQVCLDDYDAVVFVDADCTVSPSFLAAMDARLATGVPVVQGFNAVLNPNESPLTRLMQITNVLKNQLFVHAKAKLGISVQLMGTGMCIDRSVLDAVPWRAFSTGEDMEQSAYLTEAGIAIAFEAEAVVYAQEASSFDRAYSQRVRWASSRMELFGRGAHSLARGILEHNIHKLDGGLTLIAPNYAMLANLTILGALIALVANVPGHNGIALWFAVLLFLEIAYFTLGLSVSRLSMRSLASLGLAPFFLVWRLVVDFVALCSVGRLRWVRTRRSPDQPRGQPD